MKSGMFTWLFSTRHSLGLGEYVLSLFLLYEISVLFYNFYFASLILFSSSSLLLTILAYGLPLILLYMSCCVFIQRLKTVATKKRFLIPLFIGCAALRYLSEIGLGIHGVNFVSYTVANQSPFYLDLWMIGYVFLELVLRWLPLLVLFGLTLYCFKRPPENTEGLKPVFTLSVIILVILSFMDLITNFGGLYDYKYASYQRILKKAESGDPTAERTLADSYISGIGLEKNVDKAIEWYIKAFNDGDVDSAYYAGLAYEETGNDLEARKWYKIAAEKGNEWGRRKAGLLPANPPAEWGKHDISVCKKPSYEEVKCRELAIAGNAEAQFSYAEYLSIHMLTGDVRNPKSNVAFWYDEAARSGNKTALGRITLVYPSGMFYRVDLAKTIYWYQKKVDDGHDFYTQHLKFARFLEQHTREAQVP